MATTAFLGAPVEASDRPASYASILTEQTRPFDANAGPLELIRMATLAANSHNTQPWRFSLSEQRVTIAPDFQRRCPVVDPDDHHVWASLGCAAENIVQAAGALGYRATPQRSNSGDGQITLALERTQAKATPLLAAIVARQCTRSTYDGRAVAPPILDEITAAGTVGDSICKIITDRELIDSILELSTQGSGAQLRDPQFIDELTSWLRFSERDAVEARDGLFARCSGNPTMPGWIGRRLLPFVMTVASENDKLAKQIRSSSGLAVFAAKTNDPAGWIDAGRSYQRFALQSTMLGLRHAFVNQATEVATLRGQVAGVAGLGDRRPNMIVRFGMGAMMPRSLRRPTGAVVDFY
jgi:hypothetical protein